MVNEWQARSPLSFAFFFRMLKLILIWMIAIEFSELIASTYVSNK